VRARGCVGLLLIATAAGCVEAQAQPRPPTRDAGVARRDAGAARRDAGVVARRDAGAARRDAGVDVPVLPPTRGRIEAAGAQRVLATRATEVRGCYERALARDATLQGELTVRLRVEADGRVSQTALSGDDALRGAGRCMEAALRGLVFPAPAGGAATVTVPYVFRAGE
jgi:hypothetical protein